MVTLDERVGRLEGKMDSLATKEDLAIMRADIIDRMGQQRAETKDMETRLIKWMAGTVLAGMTLAASLTIALQNLLSG